MRAENIGSAHQAMKLKCSPSVGGLLQKLKAKLAASQLLLISRAYSSIEVTDASTRLDLSIDQLRSKCTELGWEISANGFVLPKPIETVDDGTGNSGDGVLESVRILERLTSYVNAFEQKAIQVDVKGTSKVDSSSSVP
jgi:hypothetical protein